MSLEQQLLLIAAAIILPLAFYAAYLQYRVHSHKQKLAAHEVDMQQKINANHDQAKKSILLFISAYQQGQMSLTELALRTDSVARALRGDSQESADIAPLLQLAEKTKHFPILDEWKKLDRRQQKKFTVERLTLEAEHQTAIDEALANISSLEQKANRNNSVSYFQP